MGNKSCNQRVGLFPFFLEFVYYKLCLHFFRNSKKKTPHTLLRCSVRLSLFACALSKRTLSQCVCVWLCILSIFHTNWETASVNLLMPSDTHYEYRQTFHLHNLSSIDTVNQSLCLRFFEKTIRALSLSVSPLRSTIHEWKNECLPVTFCYLFFLFCVGRARSILWFKFTFCCCLGTRQILYFVIVQWAMIKTKQILIYVLHIHFSGSESNRIE